MIDFQTKVELPLGEWQFGYADRLMSFGSCFSEHIGNKLVEAKFACDVNPFGILYNPLSVAAALRDVLDGRRYGEDAPELFCAGGQWHSYMHHSRFSAASREECLRLINGRLARAVEELASLDVLLLTFGTARVYRLADGRVVANCHKQPERLFVRELVSVDAIVQEYRVLIDRLLAVRPSLHILFTVSPIRHARDGFHGNQVSKSVLLLAVERLCELYSCCHYFPSYEIQLDELRDYRFYADDMLHPSALAVEYIWKCFCQTYLTDEARSLMAECLSIARALAHRPFHPESSQYKSFLTQITLKIGRIMEKYPTLDFKKELELCRTRLKQ